jgi:hypothetical protein
VYNIILCWGFAISFGGSVDGQTVQLQPDRAITTDMDTTSTSTPDTTDITATTTLVEKRHF